MSDELNIPLPGAVVDALVVTVAARLDQQARRDYMDTKTAADYLACSPNRLHKLAAEKRIPCRREGGRLLFVRGELDEWLDSGEAAA